MRRWSWLTLVLVVSTTVAAKGEESSTADPQAGAALALFRQGVDAVQRDDIEWALRAFRASYRLNPVGDVLYNIATCEQALSNYPAAANAFQEYAVTKGDAMTEEDRVEIEALLAELTPRIGRINVDCDQQGATVWIDGTVPGTTPLGRWLAVEPGRHVVFVEKPGFIPSTANIEVAAGAQHDFAVTLERLPGMTSPDSAPGEVADPDLAPTRPAVPTETPAVSSGLEPWFWTMVGLTGAAAATAFVTGGLAVKYRDDFEAGGRSDTDLYDTTLTLRVTTDALIGVAAATAVTALLLFLLDDDVEAEPDAGDTPLELGLAPMGLVLGW
ncbi:MAG: PEGA domain-containing protein [Deltaproteobacteria bacterium]|nr:PEGA domain-containing protein [Deltaproteobacteria bacterium]